MFVPARYISIRRGMIIALVLGFAITPWNLTKSSFSFTSYLSAYSIFIASICGVIIGDYFLVRKGYIDLPSLFNSREGGLYYFKFGFNWRGYLAYIIGMIPAIPGFLHTCGVESVSKGGQYLGYFGFPLGVFLGAVAYWGLCVLSPVPGGNATSWREVEPIGTGITGEETLEYMDGVSREYTKDSDNADHKSADASEKVISGV
jgi:nucleobase:cation symporter-1, NCS1 family